MSFITSYNPLPVSFTHGEGIWLYDEQGNRYLDGLSGIAVCGLGHAHPAVTETIQQQAAKLLHTSNAFHITHQERLAEKLTAMSGMEQVFFGNSGAEANEAAIKLTRLYGHQKGIDSPQVIVMDKAFHGRTMATLTASGSRKVQAGFEPLVPGFLRAPYDDIEAIKNIAKSRNDVVAIMLEPIQGEGGINPPNSNYLNQLRELCDANDWLLIVDEIQTGVGRTGKMYAYMHSDIKPDILTTAKGLGNGMPIGACLMRSKAANIFKPGNHGSTFGGNPLACATALTVLNVMAEQDICQQVEENSAYLVEQLQAHLAEHPAVKDIRGQGFMLGIELDKPCRELLKIGLKHGLLFNITAEKVIRLLPPLIISRDEIDELVKRLATCINEFIQS